MPSTSSTERARKSIEKLKVIGITGFYRRMHVDTQAVLTQFLRERGEDELRTTLSVALGLPEIKDG